MKRNIKTLLVLYLIVLLVIVFGSTKVSAVVRTDEVGDEDNTGIVVNGITIVENGEVTETIDNITYDKASNTLTLNNCVADSLRIVGMGKDFKINVIGTNTVGKGSLYEFTGPMAGEGQIMNSYMTFIGNGILNIKTTLAASEIVINGPTINVTGAIANTDCLNMQKGQLTVKGTLQYFDKAINVLDFKYSDNIEYTDTEGKEIYFVEHPDYGKTFCYTETYSEKSLVTDIVMKEKKVEEISKENESTGIKLETNTQVVPENTILEAKEVKEDKALNIVKECVKDVSTKFVTYDITLKSEGVAVQPNGKVKISIPIPNNYDKTNLSVFRIAEDGTKIKYDINVNGNYVEFETDHFSTYILAENNVVENTNNNDITTTNTTSENNNQLDETPKTGNTNYIVYISILAVISLAGIIILKKK